MARPRKGKVLTLRPIRLDDDVWAECRRLGKEQGTINEGLSRKLFGRGRSDPKYPLESGGRDDSIEPEVEKPKPTVSERPKRFVRGIRPKGDGNR